MSNFRSRILGVAAVAAAFAGVSYGQVAITCTALGVTGALNNPTLRQEGQTELLGDGLTTCAVAGAPATLNRRRLCAAVESGPARLPGFWPVQLHNPRLSGSLPGG